MSRLSIYKQHWILDTQILQILLQIYFVTKSFNEGDRNCGEVGLDTNRNTKNKIRTKKIGSSTETDVLMDEDFTVQIATFFPLKSLRTLPRLFPGVSGVCLSLRTTAPTELEHVPVKDVVVGETLTMEQVSEQLAKVTGKFCILVSGRGNLMMKV